MATPIEQHLANVARLEHDRQQAVAAQSEGAARTGEPLDYAAQAAAAKQIDIAYHRARLASAQANGISPSLSMQALASLGVPPWEPLPPVAPPIEPPPELPPEPPAATT